MNDYWNAEGGDARARAFIQEWLDSGGAEETSKAVRDVLSPWGGFRPQVVLVDEIDGYRPQMPIIVSRQLYDRLAAAYPEIVIEARAPLQVDRTALAEAVAPREVGCRAPSAPLIPLDCI